MDRNIGIAKRNWIYFNESGLPWYYNRTPDPIKCRVCHRFFDNDKFIINLHDLVYSSYVDIFNSHGEEYKYQREISICFSCRVMDPETDFGGISSKDKKPCVNCILRGFSPNSDFGFGCGLHGKDFIFRNPIYNNQKQASQN